MRVLVAALLLCVSATASAQQLQTRLEQVNSTPNSLSVAVTVRNKGEQNVAIALVPPIPNLSANNGIQYTFHSMSGVAQCPAIHTNRIENCMQFEGKNGIPKEHYTTIAPEQKVAVIYTFSARTRAREEPTEIGFSSTFAALVGDQQTTVSVGLIYP